MNVPRVAVVVPTIGRPELRLLLQSLTKSVPVDTPVVLVDDSRDGRVVAAADLPPAFPALNLRVVASGGRGPAAARNHGWRAVEAEWIAFLDDDVAVGDDWWRQLTSDLDAAGPSVHGSQGRIEVPLPRDRRPTDFERGTAGPG